MKKVYIKRNDLFKPLRMILLNNICEVDEGFIDDNPEVFYSEPEDGEIDKEISRLKEIDWSKEEYKPYEITDKMNPEEIEKHLQGFRDDIQNDLEDSFMEPYQYFIIDAPFLDWELERLKDYGVTVGYSEKLDHYILPIYDFGTGWDMFSYSKEVDNDYTLAHDETLDRKTCF